MHSWPAAQLYIAGIMRSVGATLPHRSAPFAVGARPGADSALSPGASCSLRSAACSLGRSRRPIGQAPALPCRAVIPVLATSVRPGPELSGSRPLHPLPRLGHGGWPGLSRSVRSPRRPCRARPGSSALLRRAGPAAVPGGRTPQPPAAGHSADSATADAATPAGTWTQTYLAVRNPQALPTPRLRAPHLRTPRLRTPQPARPRRPRRPDRTPARAAQLQTRPRPHLVLRTSSARSPGLTPAGPNCPPCLDTAKQLHKSP